MNVIFFETNFCERGTSVATYDYAKYNEDCLNNKSYIVCFSEEATQRMNADKRVDIAFKKFKDRFDVIEIDSILDLKQIIFEKHIDFFYVLMYGVVDRTFAFDNKDLWQGCKTIKHCVFSTQYKEGDYYIAIGHQLNETYKTNYQVVPHIVDLPDTDKDLRTTLNIPKESIVFGRYGGADQFDINFVKYAIIEVLNMDKNIYFLFMNTNKFYIHERIIYLDRTCDLLEKSVFINTCDAMIHARCMGETFGLSVGEFSSKNKPIITCNTGDKEHLKILGEKAIIYTNKDQLIGIFTNFKTYKDKHVDWNCYKEYNPKTVMSLFNKIFTST